MPSNVKLQEVCFLVTVFAVSLVFWQMAIVSDRKALYGELKAEKTPGYPGVSLVKSQDDPIDLDVFRKFLGRIMWLVRKVAPECGNATRELAMYMDSTRSTGWLLQCSMG